MVQVLESDTQRNGFASYPGEVHALSYGLIGGFIAGLTYGTGYQKVGIGVVLSIIGGALEIKRLEKISNSSVVQELHKEPQYTCGAIPVGFALSILFRIAIATLL